jgi:phage-related protein
MPTHNKSIDIPVKVTGIEETENTKYVTFGPVEADNPVERQMSGEFTLAFTLDDEFEFEIDQEVSFVGPRPRKPH